MNQLVVPGQTITMVAWEWKIKNVKISEENLMRAQRIAEALQTEKSARMGVCESAEYKPGFSIHF